MAEILTEENSIILAATQKMVSEGFAAAQLILNGEEAYIEDESANKILTLLTVYKRKTDLEDKELEAILFCLKDLSEEDVFPTISPVVGLPIVYVEAISTDGYWRDQGSYDASTNLFPSVNVRKGYTWNIGVSGVLAGVSVDPGAVIRALANNPGQILSNWAITY